MKKSLFLASFAALMMVACHKDAPVVTPEAEDDSPVAVEFGVSSPSLRTKVLTRAAGTVGDLADNEATNVWNGQTLYVYGFNKAAADLATGVFIDNIAVTAPVGEVANTLTPKRVDNGESFLYQGTTNYSFYGYYADDALTAAPTINATTVTAPFKITGGQDLMIATTNVENDIAARPDQSKNVNADRVYSAYSARRGVTPNLVFEHLLSRFTFNVVVASESAKNLQVETLGVVSQSTGTVTLVGAEVADAIAADEATETLFLMQKDTETENNLVALAPVALTDMAVNTTFKLGESLMVVPGKDTYRLILTTKFTEASGLTQETEPLKADINIKNVLVNGDQQTSDTVFMPGKSYDITLMVYGPEEVKVMVTLQGWENGGSQVIDPDADDYVEPEE